MGFPQPTASTAVSHIVAVWERGCSGLPAGHCSQNDRVRKGKNGGKETQQNKYSKATSASRHRVPQPFNMPSLCFCFWLKAACGAGPRREGSSGNQHRSSPQPGGRPGAPGLVLHGSGEPRAAPQGAMGAGAPCSMITLHSAAPQPSASVAAEKPHSVLCLMPDQTVLPNEGALQSACNAEFLMLPRALLHTEGEAGAGSGRQGAHSPRQTPTPLPRRLPPALRDGARTAPIGAPAWPGASHKLSSSAWRGDAKSFALLSARARPGSSLKAKFTSMLTACSCMYRTCSLRCSSQ